MIQTHPDFWKYKLAMFFHDPPDKAYDILGHEKRADYLRQLHLDSAFRETKGEAKAADWIASTMDRVPMAKGPDYYVSWNKGAKRIIYHPLGGDSKEISLSSEEAQRTSVTVSERLCTGVWDENQAREAFLYHWRFYRKALIAEHPDWAYLPADTRLPDHTIWDHMDMTSALEGAFRDPRTGQRTTKPAFLTFSVGPVQDFIAAGRKLRDLKMGSFLISYLSYIAAEVVANTIGPDAVIMPCLWDVELYDRCLKEWFDSIERGSNQDFASNDEALFQPAIPNKILALVPDCASLDLAKQIEKTVREEWGNICEKVRLFINQKVEKPWKNQWAKNWDKQIQEALEITWSTLPWPGEERKDSFQCLSKYLENWNLDKSYQWGVKIREVLKGLLEDYMTLENRHWGDAYAGLYQAAVAFFDAQKQARLTFSTKGDSRPKSVLDGRREAMGPDTNRTQFREFWKSLSKSFGTSQLRENEYLDAVGLVKRFGLKSYFKEEFNVKSEGFDSIADVCLASIEAELKTISDYVSLSETLDADDLKDQLLNQNWIQKDKRVKLILNVIRQKKLSLSPYYGLLVMDGDQMGAWISGDHPNIPTILESHHPDYRKALNLKINLEELKIKRPNTPSRHRALTRALTHFSKNQVPKLVKKHNGLLVYSGGDDVLVLAPLDRILPLAFEIRSVFSSFECMGSNASLSAGLVIAHYREPLSLVLAEARQSEKEAKNLGRDRLRISLMKRSGEDPRVTISLKQNHAQETLKLIDQTITAFKEADLSPRIIRSLNEFLNDSDLCQLVVEDKSFQTSIKSLWVREFKRHSRDNKDDAGFGSQWFNYAQSALGEGDQLSEVVKILGLCSFMSRGGKKNENL